MLPLLSNLLPDCGLVLSYSRHVLPQLTVNRDKAYIQSIGDVHECGLSPLGHCVIVNSSRRQLLRPAVASITRLIGTYKKDFYIIAAYAELHACKAVI